MLMCKSMWEVLIYIIIAIIIITIIIIAYVYHWYSKKGKCL